MKFNLKILMLSISLAQLCFPICAQTLALGACTQSAQASCTDATPCKTDSNGDTACLLGSPLPNNAVQLTQTCWNYAYIYTCQGTSTDTCSQYSSNNLCSQQNSSCTGYLGETGECNSWSNRYSCQTLAARTSQQVQCASNITTPLTIATNETKNTTFIQAALALEIANETQTYSQSPNNIFYGVSESCTVGDLGIKNCCQTTPGGKANSVAFGLVFGASASVVKYAGQSAVDTGSAYVFDTLYANGSPYSQGLYESMIASSNIVASESGDIVGTQFASGGFSLSAYGFTYSATSIEGSGLMGATTELGTSGVYFNPYAFAAYAAITIIENAASCTPSEQLLGLHRGSNLSQFEHQYCSNKTPIINTCIEWTSQYCSFNSVLAKIINTQGKAQLGIDPSSCSGLTQSELTHLNMSKIDFSQFTASMTGQALTHIPTSKSISTNYQPIVNAMPRGSSQKSGSEVLPTFK